MHRAGHASPAAALRYQDATVNRDDALANALADLSAVTLHGQLPGPEEMRWPRRAARLRRPYNISDVTSAAKEETTGNENP
jgi:hypothetical protein